MQHAWRRTLTIQVVSQIDKLTAGIDLDTEDDLEEHKLTLASGSGSSERALEELFKPEAFTNNRDLHHLLHNPLLDMTKRQEPALYRRSCGDLPALNGPLKAPYSPKTCWLFGSGERIHHCDKALDHALCCDDDDDDVDEESAGRRSSRFSSNDSVFSSSPPRPLRMEALTPRSTRKYQLSPGSKKKALRSCSTQTVSDKSTQTPFPYSPARQRASSEHKL
ncbi:inhibitory synaptic factor 1 isoform X2 [Hoplias malabaricus]|uniref:inhibitory synaptic factor 1 isoform X2 n=1 Tax=Hoplias malabaricus TaxID=27720 RepID=UPI00346208AD